ncbi:hypothetical protein ACFLV0_04595 [Chloroflexota bacterium]
MLSVLHKAKLQIEDIAEEKKLVPSREAEYFITFTQSREILLNNAYQIAKPDFDRENEQIFNYLYNHPNKKFTKENLERELGTTLVKTLHKIVENLGFSGPLRTAFFNVSQDSIEFKSPVKSEDLLPSAVNKLNSLIAKA